MQQFENFLTDRGSKYAVSGGPVSSRAEIKTFLKQLCRDKRYAKATHNTWAAILPDDGPAKGDDGEAGAGMVILRMLEREGIVYRSTEATIRRAPPRGPARFMGACSLAGE